MNWKKKLTTCAAAAAAASFFIYTMNKLTYFLATVDNLLKTTDGRTYEWKFGNIFYTKKGNGKPLLLIHDLNPSSSGYEWHRIENQLAKKYTVYTIDLLGCGRSDKPDVTYTNFLYVQLITDFIKNVIGEKTDIISSGEPSSFVTMACRNDDSIIDRIIMINPLSLQELSQVPTKKAKIQKFLISVPILGTLLYNILVSRREIESDFFMDYFYSPSKAEDSYLKTYYETAHLDSCHGKYLYASLRGNYTKANITTALKELNNSIFILSGIGTPDNKTVAEQYKHLAPSIESVDIDKAKGLPHLEVPLEVLEQIAIFFDDAIDSIADDISNSTADSASNITDNAANTNDTAHDVI